MVETAQGVLQRLKRKYSIKKVYIFPLILIAVLIVLSGLRISGSSLGIYHSSFYGDAKQDPDLITGQPRPIRSDEYLVNSQLAIAQDQNDFNRINTNFGQGIDMSLIGDAPYKEWSVAFKPHNLAFFVLPFENAFAFRWWSLLVVLAISAYAFMLKIFPQKIGLAIFFAIIVSCNPFVFWWYQTGTLGTLSCGFLLLLLGMSLIKKNNLRLSTKMLGEKTSLAIKTLCFSYVLTAFTLLLYPAYLIPMSIVIGCFLLGFFFENVEIKKVRSWISIAFSFLAAGFLAMSTIALFLYTRQDAINALAGTVYPGSQNVHAGGQEWKKFFVTYLQPQLQREHRGENYFSNQSEASSFIILPHYFLVPSFVLLAFKRIKKLKTSWILLLLFLCNIVFISNLFIPQSNFVSKIFFLHLVQHDRLLMSIGFLGLITLAVFMRDFANLRQSSPRITYILIAYTTFYLIFALIIGFKTRAAYPEFISSGLLIIFLCGFLGAGLYGLATSRFVWGFGIIAVFSLVSVFQIHPLYQGVGVIGDTKLNREIKAVSDDNSTWAVVDSIWMENFPQINDRHSIGGISVYPHLNYWEKILGKRNDEIYNRYAHILADMSDSKARLIQADLYTVSVDCEMPLSRKVDFLLTTQTYDLSCAHIIRTVKYPAVTFYIYEMNH